jgi:anthranilate/para-aminobenzoate synthase component II
MQALVTAYGGTVARVRPAHGEVAEVTHDGTGVFRGLPDPVAMVRYHSLAAVEVPEVLRVTALAGPVVMGVVHRDLPLHGVQFHPESVLSEHGNRLVANFLEAA